MLLNHERTPLPENRKKPIWETSNSPAAFLVARCSSGIEEYHIGNSKPWKSTILPPASRWDWCKAVLIGEPSDTPQREVERCKKLWGQSFRAPFNGLSHTPPHRRWRGGVCPSLGS